MVLIQFIHLDGYGRTPKRGCAAWQTIEGTTAEAERLPGNHRHIQHVADPRLLYGENPVKVGEAALVLSRLAKDSCGRRLRSDAVTLLAVL